LLGFLKSWFGIESSSSDPAHATLVASATRNDACYPAPGQIIFYPGETGILLAYGGVHFAGKMGQLAGNHFITLTSGLET
jgi:hypothetical protein